MSLDPPLAQEGEKIGGEHGVAVAPALATFDAQEHAGGVDVADLQARDLRGAQARPVGDRERRQMLQAHGGAQQPADLVRLRTSGRLRG